MSQSRDKSGGNALIGREHAPQTVAGHQGLDHEEPLIFELDAPGRTGVDLPEVEIAADRLGGLARRGPTAGARRRTPPTSGRSPACRRP